MRRMSRKCRRILWKELEITKNFLNYESTRHLKPKLKTNANLNTHLKTSYSKEKKEIIGCEIRDSN